MTMKLIYLMRALIISLLISCTVQLSAQFTSFKLDSTFQSITVAGIATTILAPNDLEIQFNNVFNSFWFRLYEFNAENFRRTADNRRITSFSETLRIQYGFSKDQRWDLGLETKFNWFRNDDYARSSPFRVFGNKTETGTSYRGLAGLGVRFRAMPLSSKPNWIVQGLYSFPIGNQDKLEKRLLNADLNQFDLLTTYYEGLNEKTYYFVQANWSSQFSPQRTNHAAGAAFYLIRDLWNGLVYIYPGLSYGFVVQNQKKGGLSTYSHIVFAGLGGQYAVQNNFQLYAIWQYPLLLDNGSLFSDIIPASFTSISVGFRLTLDR